MKSAISMSLSFFEIRILLKKGMGIISSKTSLTIWMIARSSCNGSSGRQRPGIDGSQKRATGIHVNKDTAKLMKPYNAIHKIRHKNKRAAKISKIRLYCIAIDSLQAVVAI